MRKYLLGELLEDDRVAVEEEYFADQALLSRLLEVEDELIDQYHGGRLAPADRVRFEEQFLSTPTGRRKVELAWDLRELRSAASGSAGLRTGSGAWLGRGAALAAALLLAAAAGLWLNRERGAGPAVPAPPREAAASATPPASQAPQGGVLSVTLAPGLLRGPGGATAFAVPPSTRTVRLLLPLARHEYSQYRASLQNAEGQELAAEGPLSSQADPPRRVVAFAVRAELLAPRTYVVILSGLTRDGLSEPAGEYVFRVTRP